MGEWNWMQASVYAHVTAADKDTDPVFTLRGCCRDMNEDCEKVGAPTRVIALRNGHLACWLHDPTRGWCPYLPKPEGPKRV